MIFIPSAERLENDLQNCHEKLFELQQEPRSSKVMVALEAFGQSVT